MNQSFMSAMEVAEELKRISAGTYPSEELLEDIALISTTLNGINGRSSDDCH